MDFILEASAWQYLRYERRCKIVTMQRGLECNHNPDVLGVGPGRKCIEIEIKRTLSDFKADAKKHITRFRERDILNVSQFYYLVPIELVDRVKPILPTYAGLLTLSEKKSAYSRIPEIECVVRARINPHCYKLSVHKMADLVAGQTGTIMKLLTIICRTPSDVVADECLPPAAS